MVLRDDRQFQLGLGMMAADVRSGLTREERLLAIGFAQRGEVPGVWRWRVQRYLDARREARDGRGDD